mgnify:CR=1 FL=1
MNPETNSPNNPSEHAEQPESQHEQWQNFRESGNDEAAHKANEQDMIELTRQRLAAAEANGDEQLATTLRHVLDQITHQD